MFTSSISTILPVSVAICMNISATNGQNGGAMSEDIPRENIVSTMT